MIIVKRETTESEIRRWKDDLVSSIKKWEGNSEERGSEEMSGKIVQGERRNKIDMSRHIFLDISYFLEWSMKGQIRGLC